VKTKLTFERLFAYSEKSNQCFNTVFGKELNVVHGKNTSGKSTLFHSILFAMGINENNKLLSEILEYGVVFRLDCLIEQNNQSNKISFIREDDTLIIVSEDKPIKKFIGISANQSSEHVSLKEYISNLFNFTLKLEQKGVIKNAPLEAMVLPYYISQSVGWVYLRKSFGNLDFFKNFREDYLDYYTGIMSCVDREKKTELQRKLRFKDAEIEFFTNMELNNSDLAVTKLLDETYLNISAEYVEDYGERQKKSDDLERQYTLKCNELSHLNKRLKILRKVSKNHKMQIPEEGTCPTCSQLLPHSLSDWYEYYQDENNTFEEIQKCNDELKKVTSKIHSLRKAIENEKKELMKRFEILKKRDDAEMSLNSWLDNKANVKLIENCSIKLGELTKERKNIENELKIYKTEEEVQAERNKKGKEFSTLFRSYLKEIGIHNLNDRRYNHLFEITAFPMQGVELHKTVMAYHFAFNKYISSTDYVHRVPFMLDAIFKEDFELDNMRLVLDFIYKYKPSDTQSIISIAETKNDNGIIEDYKKNHFGSSAKLICIGNSTDERSFLSEYDNKYDTYLEQTYDYISR